MSCQIVQFNSIQSNGTKREMATHLIETRIDMQRSTKNASATQIGMGRNAMQPTEKPVRRVTYISLLLLLLSLFIRSLFRAARPPHNIISPCMSLVSRRHMVMFIEQTKGEPLCITMKHPLSECLHCFHRLERWKQKKLSGIHGG